MDEPPIQRSNEEDNPFAPSSLVDEISVNPSHGVYLPFSFWATFAVALVVFLAATYFFYGMFIPAIVALAAAVVRVPIMQTQLAKSHVPHRPMSPVVMLLISWCFMLLACFAALFAFVVVCVPISVFSFSGASGTGDNAIFTVFGASGLVAFGCFLFLFYLSTKLPV